MMPTVAEERRMALARKYRQYAPQLATRWRSNGLLVSLLFFALTIVGVVATWGFLKLLGAPEGWVTAAVAIGLAEWLILRRRFFGTGVESALWIGGLVAVITALPGQTRSEVLVLLAAAALVTAARMRSALFALAAVVLITIYLRVEGMSEAAFILPFSVSVLSMFALMRTWQRPSVERLFSLLVVALPVVAAVAGPPLTPWWSLLWLSTGAVFFFVAMKRRHHALFLASFVTLAIASAFDDGLLLKEPWALIAIGAALLAAAGLLTSALAGRTNGFVLGDAEDDRPLEILATVQLSPVVDAPPDTPGDGGSFGGAGASGKF